jgi:multidrug efflux system membrane fusion protein
MIGDWLQGLSRLGRRQRWAVGLGAAALMALFAVLLRGPHKQEASAPAVPVTTARVASGDVFIEQEVLGRVMAINTVAIRPQVGGQVTAIHFKDGQYVNQGDLLVQIDPRPLEATVAQGKALVARDRTQLASAQTDLERYVPLLARGVVSAQQVSDQRALVQQLRSTLAADQATLTRNQVELTYTSITAPIGGVLGLTLIDVGNVLDPAHTAAVVSLTQIQPITVLFPVPQDSLADIQERQAASKTGLPVEAWSQDGSRKLDAGALLAVSNEVDPSTGTVMLKAVFPNPRHILWPGASVEVRLMLEVVHQGLTVPREAVSLGPEGPYAWAVASDGTVTMVPLKIRQQLRGQVLVASGLSAGEQVVTNGQYGLTPGAHVSIQSPSQTQARLTPLRTDQPGRLGISP